MSPATSADGHHLGPQRQTHKSHPNTSSSQPQHHHARHEFVAPHTDPRAHESTEAAQRPGTQREREILNARLTTEMKRARDRIQRGRQTPRHFTDNRSPSAGSHLMQQAAFYAAIDNLDALERAVESAPSLEEQSGRGRHASLNLS